MEAKSFVVSILDGASVLWVEEKRKCYSGAVILSNQCTAWLALTMEVLVGLEQRWLFSGGGGLWSGWMERAASNP